MTDIEDLLDLARETRPRARRSRRPSRPPARAPPDGVDPLATAERIVLTGAGSSYYVAQIVAAARAGCGRGSVVAVPLSEVILRPEGVLPPRHGGGRSGAGGDRLPLRNDDGGRRGRGPAAGSRPADHRRHLPRRQPARSAAVSRWSRPADEPAIVMTRSFASLTALLLRLVARSRRDDRLATDLDRVPDAGPRRPRRPRSGRRWAHRLASRSWCSAAVPLSASPTRWCSS